MPVSVWKHCMRNCEVSRTSMPVARWMKGEGARFAVPEAGGGATGGLGQSCFVMACMLRELVSCAATVR